MNKNVLKIVALVIILILTYIVFAIVSIDYNEKIKEFLKYKNFSTYVFDNNIKIEYKPMPVIYVKNIYIENILSIDEAKIEVSLLSILKGSIPDSNITLSNVSLKYATEDKKISKIQILKDANKIMRYFDNVNIDIHSMSILEGDNLKFRILELEDRDNELSFQLKKDFYVNLLRIKDKLIKISVQDSNKYNVELLANYDQDDNLVDCDISAQSVNISYLIEDNYIGKNLEADKKINLNCKLINSDKGVSIKNFNIKGTGIEGTGYISDLEKLPNMNFIFNYVDLNKLLDKQDSEYAQISSINKNMNFDIRINDLKYKNESFNNINISLLHNKDTDALEIKKFKGTIKSGGALSCIGNVKNDSYRSVFDGRFIIKHKNINDLLKNMDLGALSIDEIDPLTIISNLHISDTEFVLNDLFMQFSNINTTGSISIKLIGKTPRINCVLSVSDIDMNKKYPIISEFANNLSAYFQGMQIEDYVAKYNHIRTMSYVGNYYLNITNIKSNELVLDNINLSAYAVKNLLYVSLFSAKNKDFSFNSSLKVDTSLLNPKIELIIQDGVVKNYSPIFEALNALYNNFDTKNININIKAKNNVIQDFASDIEFEIKNDKRIINISNLSANLKEDNAKIKLLGNLVIKPFKANVGFYVENLNLSKNSYALAFSPIKSGIASIGGSVFLMGDNANEIFANIHADGSLSIKNGTFQGFSIDDFITSIRMPNYNGVDINDKTSKYSNSGFTNISSMNGSYKLNNGIFSLNNAGLLTNNSSGKLSGFTNLYTKENKLSYSFDFYLDTPDKNNRTYSATFDMNGKINDSKKNISIGNNTVEYFSKLKPN